MFQLARRIERIAVHHDASGAQGAEHRHRILQHVGHHDRHARALAQTTRLQPGAEQAREPIELAERDELAQIRIGGAIAILRGARFEQRPDRRILVPAHFGRNPLWIALQPDFFHVRFRFLSPVERRAVWRRATLPPVAFNPMTTHGRRSAAALRPYSRTLRPLARAATPQRRRRTTTPRRRAGPIRSLNW